MIFLRSQIATTEVIEDEYVTLLRSQIATAKDISKSRNKPFAFTRNGIAMLSSVLRSDTAVEVNKRIMRAFTAIPDLVNHNTLINVEMIQKGSVPFCTVPCAIIVLITISFTIFAQHLT